MGFNMLSVLAGILPKRVLIFLAAIFAVLFLVYFKGVSDGREPYRQSVKVDKIKGKIFGSQAKVNRSIVKQKGAKANVEADKYVCTVSGVTAEWLSNLKL